MFTKRSLAEKHFLRFFCVTGESITLDDFPNKRLKNLIWPGPCRMLGKYY